jgi:hypothetical protein
MPARCSLQWSPAPASTGTQAAVLQRPLAERLAETLRRAANLLSAETGAALLSLVSPKLLKCREMRADLGMAGYERSALLRYLEEALAESYAQLRVHGVRGLPAGIRFPVANGYVTLSAVLKEAAVAAGLGTIAVAGIIYAVNFEPRRP